MNPCVHTPGVTSFGDDPARYASAKARKNYAGTGPHHPGIRQEPHRPGPLRPQQPFRDALQNQGFCALRASPGARRYYDEQRAREAGYSPAFRQLGNRLVGILHGCLKTPTRYDEAIASSHLALPHPA